MDKIKNNKNTRIAFRVTQSDRELMDYLCKKEDRSISNLIRRAIKLYAQQVTQK